MVVRLVPRLEEDTSLEEFREKNEQVAAEIEEYYDDSITDSELKAYLSEKLTSIYGDEFEQMATFPMSEYVEGYFKDVEKGELEPFSGVNSYRELVTSIEDFLKIMRNTERYKEYMANKTKIDPREEGQAAEKTTGISKGTLNNISNTYKNVSMQGELTASQYLNSTSKKMGISRDELMNQLREKMIEDTNHPEKVLHYHRTSLDRFEKIVDSGALLSRANIIAQGGNTREFSGSSSSKVQFTVDSYDTAGNLTKSGYEIGEGAGNTGANATDIVFVMNPDLMKEKSYDGYGMYPTVEKAELQEYVASILAKDEQTQQKALEILARKGIQVPVILQKDFERQDILKQYEHEKHSPKSKETGYRLARAEAWSSAVEATQEVIKTSDIQEAKQPIIEAAKENGVNHYPPTQKRDGVPFNKYPPEEGVPFNKYAPTKEDSGLDID